MISIGGHYFDVVTFTVMAIPNAAIALILLATRDALRKIRRAERHATEAVS